MWRAAGDCVKAESGGTRKQGTTRACVVKSSSLRRFMCMSQRLPLSAPRCRPCQQRPSRRQPPTRRRSAGQASVSKMKDGSSAARVVRAFTAVVASPAIWLILEPALPASLEAVFAACVAAPSQHGAPERERHPQRGAESRRSALTQWGREQSGGGRGAGVSNDELRGRETTRDARRACLRSCERRRRRAARSAACRRLGSVGMKGVPRESWDHNRHDAAHAGEAGAAVSGASAHGRRAAQAAQRERQADDGAAPPRPARPPVTAFAAHLVSLGADRHFERVGGGETKRLVARGAKVKKF